MLLLITYYETVGEGEIYRQNEEGLTTENTEDTEGMASRKDRQERKERGNQKERKK